MLSRRAYFQFLLVLAVGAVPTGCSEPRAQVRGTVTLAAKPLASGLVQFMSSTGVMEIATIAEDGTYTIPSMKPGEYKVTVSNPSGVSAAAGMGVKKQGLEPNTSGRPANAEPTADAKAREIPLEYTNFETTKLSVTLAAGKNDFDIAMH